MKTHKCTNTSWASCRGAHLAPVETFPTFPDVTLDVSIQLGAEELDFLLWPRKKSNITMGRMINRPHFKLPVERVRPGWPFDWLRRLAENCMLHLPGSKGCSRGSRPNKKKHSVTTASNETGQPKILYLLVEGGRIFLIPARGVLQSSEEWGGSHQGQIRSQLRELCKGGRTNH